MIPLYLIIFLGWWLQYRKLYTAEVNKFITFITYRIMLPLSIFVKISTSEIAITDQTLFFFGIMLAQLLLFFIIFQKTYRQKGFESLVNSIRGNSIYLGFPIMMQLLPAPILPLGMVLASAISPLTIFGIEVLYKFNRYKRNESKIRRVNFLTNPLIQGLVLGVIFNYFNIWHPLLGEVITQFTRPVMFLSLIIVGANFNTASLKQAKLSLHMAVILLIKIIVVPVMFMVAATQLKFDPGYTAVGIILFSTPGAVTNYVILSELGEASDLTVNCTIIGTALYLLLLPLIGYLVNLSL